jgi:beta-N-acetylhexosaminidase
VLKACEAASSAGFVLASELRACGVDFSFTPVLDLDHGESGVIGDRAFARDPRVVSLLARSLMQGLLQAGMGNCGKHFPGHGAVKADSHVALPVDKRSLKAILADDAQPYRWLGSVLTAVMPAHVIYSQVDSRPAGFSPRWLQDILRGQLGFQGVICTDDLSMAAARQLEGRTLSYTEAVITALHAGCDLAMLCNRSAVNGGAELDEVLDQLAEAQLKAHWTPSEVSEERRLGLLPVAPPRDWESLVRSANYMQALDRLP